MDKIKYLFTIILTTSIISCSGPYKIFTDPEPEAITIKDEQIFNADKQKTWDAVIETMKDKKFPISSSDYNIGKIQTEKVKFAYDYIDKYTTMEKRFFQGKFSFIFQLSEIEGKTKVKIVSDFEGTYNKSDTKGNVETPAITIYSNGKFEKEIFDELSNKLK